MSKVRDRSSISLGPMPPSSNDQGQQSPIPKKDKVAMNSSQTSKSLGSNLSSLPSPKNVKTSHGHLLTPLPGRLTPTGQGRIKAPPVCVAPSLKRAASTIDDLTMERVCFTPQEAQSCAEKALMLEGACASSGHLEEMPLNIEKCDPEFSWDNHHAESNCAASSLSWVSGWKPLSSSSTVITTSTTSSCGRSVMWNEVGTGTVNKGPPLEVVRTDLAVNTEDDLSGIPASAALQPELSTLSVFTIAAAGKAPKLVVSTTPDATATALSTTFTDNLVKENSSRQGRSLQRWLIHSTTDELVRQVAGTVPITCDGQIILVSSSRKNEWILPKGGWDEDETKEECAARETFEEAGLLGQLGGCLEPIDFESNKAKRRRLSKVGSGGRIAENPGDEVGQREPKTIGQVEGEDGGMHKFHPPQPKRVKSDNALLIKTSVSSESAYSQGGSFVNHMTHSSLTMPGSTSFDPKNYSYVRLFLFPLYVTSVKSEWPEKGRLRKLVEIEEAIQIMKSENRPYFQRGLEMIKERGLHMLKPQDS